MTGDPGAAFGLTPDQLLDRLTAAALEPVEVTDGQLDLTILDLGGMTAIGSVGEDRVP